MPNYGFTVNIFRLFQRNKPADPLPFDVEHFGNGRTLPEFFHDELLSLHGSSGHDDDQLSTWFTINEFENERRGSDPLPLMIEVDGGSYGKQYGRYDVTAGTKLDSITTDQALTREGYVFFVLDESASVGIIIAEAEGVATHLRQVASYLNARLKTIGLNMRIDREATDVYAWDSYIADPDTWTESIRFTKPNPAGDGTGLGGRGMKAAKLELDFIEGSRLEKEVSKEAKRAAKTKNVTFVSVATNGAFDDSDFGEASVTLAKDSRRRTLRITRDYPRFIYEIDSDSRPDRTALLTASRSVCADLANALSLDIGTGQWPR